MSCEPREYVLCASRGVKETREVVALKKQAYCICSSGG